MLGFKELVENGVTIKGLVGSPLEIYPQVVGKHIAFSTQVDYFGFNYIVRVDSVEQLKNQVVIHGKWLMKDKEFFSDHTTGKNLIVCLWVLEDYPTPTV